MAPREPVLGAGPAGDWLRWHSSGKPTPDVCAASIRDLSKVDSEINAASTDTEKNVKLRVAARRLAATRQNARCFG